MDTSRLKSLLITACCLVFSLFAKSQAMDDNRSDSQEIIQCKIGHSEIYLDSLKTEEYNIGFHNAMLPLNQDEDEKSTESWGSYVTSPIKDVIHGAYNIADFAVKHPTQAIVTSLIIGAFTAMVSTLHVPSADCMSRCRSEGDMVEATRIAYCVQYCARHLQW